MDPAVVAARLASSVITPLVRKLFVHEGRGADLVVNPMRISGFVSFRGEKRTLTEKDIRKLTTELVHRACAVDPREAPVPPDERQAVADALTRTLVSLGDLVMDDVQAVQLGHKKFARQLRAASWGADRELSADGTALYEGLLEACSLHILHFFTQRSSFVARTLAEQSGQLDELVAKVDQLITRNPAIFAQDAEFERSYTKFLAERYNQLEIIGIDVSRRDRARWPLDTTYLSLEVSRLTEGSVFGEGPGAPRGRQRVEHALSLASRVLLRGPAGSGKTTLMQWLAVATSSGRLGDELSRFRDHIPFVLPLRTLIHGRGQLPTPRDFLSAVGNPHTGAQPDGWAERVLSEGRALLLVDGVDEIPERQREAMYDWLRSLLIAYPDNPCVVTCRPSAVPPGWLDADHFAELTLLPMSPGDVAGFITRWHDAALASTGDPEERDALARYQETLLDAVRAKDDLARLATNPLMCALVCTLHRDRRGRFPEHRMELYDAALSMLLVRRDDERRVGAPEGIVLPEHVQIRLLQRLAYWLIVNGRNEIEQSVALDVVGRTLGAMGNDDSEAPRTLRYLLLRSGLLRQPAPDTVDFVHRTFQDYLGAKAIVENHDFDLLVDKAADSQWEDVLHMAVWHARPQEKTKLLRKLIERGNRDEYLRHRMHLLAAACLQPDTELDPPIHDEVRDCARALLPPRTPADAERLAMAGPALLGLLSGPDGLSEQEAAAVVATAALIGGDNAIRVMERFSGDHRAEVRRMLVQFSSRLDPDDYARRVLSRVPLDGLRLSVESLDELKALRHLERVWALDCHGDFSVAELRDHMASRHVVDLLLMGNNALSDLDLIRELPSLRRLAVLDFDNLASIDVLPSTQISDLRLHSLPERLDFGPLRSMTTLRSLGFGTRLPGDPSRGLMDLPLPPQLEDLTITGGVEPVWELHGIDQWPRLRTLHIANMASWGFSGVQLRPLAALTGLRRLSVELHSIDQLADLPVMAGITHLWLRTALGNSGLGHVRQVFPGLELLHLTAGRGLHRGDLDVAPLSYVAELVLSIPRAISLVNEDQLPPGSVRPSDATPYSG